MIKPLLSAQWIAYLGEFSRLIIGFSGGLDSTVLLHSLASQPSLKHKLIAVHINHGLHANAPNWQYHCEQSCLNWDIGFIAHLVQFDRSSNIEEGARAARYVLFSSLLSTQDCLILAHHRDDQAETLLLQLFRGAGVDGLAAMVEVNTLGPGTLARPFLSCTRAQLEHYAAHHELQWIEDESNQESYYSRNYLRHQIMPLLIKRWPSVVTNISRAASHCQQAKRNLDELAISDSQELLFDHTSISIETLKTLNIDRMSNVLRVWLKKNQVLVPSTATFQRLLNEVLEASPDATPLVTWAGVEVRRYQQRLYLLKKKSKSLPEAISWPGFPAPLILAEQSMHLLANKVNQGLVVPKNTELIVRFRQGGEQFYWHGQNKSLKKLFQEWAIPPWLRDQIPLIYIQDKLAAVVGYGISDLFFSRQEKEAWEFRQVC